MTDNLLLLERARQGDTAAEAELVEGNMGLVMSIVRRFCGRGYDTEELAQLGTIGLIKAVKRFDPTFKVCFSTYAVPMIIGEIKRFLRDDGPIKVSRALRETAASGRNAENRLRLRLGRDPTLAEISAEVGIAREELVHAFEATALPSSLSATDEEEREKIELLPSKSSENDIINRVLLDGLLKALGERERLILMLRYFRGKTQSQIADIIGVSQVQVSRIEKKAIEKMRRTAEQSYSSEKHISAPSEESFSVKPS